MELKALVILRVKQQPPILPYQKQLPMILLQLLIMVTNLPVKIRALVIAELKIEKHNHYFSRL